MCLSRGVRSFNHKTTLSIGQLDECALLGTIQELERLLKPLDTLSKTAATHRTCGDVNRASLDEEYFSAGLCFSAYLETYKKFSGLL